VAWEDTACIMHNYIQHHPHHNDRVWSVCKFARLYRPSRGVAVHTCWLCGVGALTAQQIVCRFCSFVSQVTVDQQRKFNSHRCSKCQPAKPGCLVLLTQLHSLLLAAFDVWGLCFRTHAEDLRKASHAWSFQEADTSASTAARLQLLL
jgi:hypothetical protein